MTTDTAPGDGDSGTEPGPEPGTAGRTAWGFGLATTTDAGQVLDTWYPAPALGTPGDEASQTAGSGGSNSGGAGSGGSGSGGTGGDVVPPELQALEGTDERRRVRRSVVRTGIDLDAAPAGASDVYLRLHLLSHRLVRPHEANLDGIFGHLANVVWTSEGPCAVDGFEATRLRLLASGRAVQVLGIDKFPRMSDYAVPAGVRIADADRVRLGAHLASGTTVMHEGFVNYNAGTLGASMVEGRISAGVVVGDGSDVGGGASIMGTLSGGGTAVISVGEGCLLGANSGIGISLGDRCVVEAGCYVTAGTKVTLPDGSVVKALELSGRDDLLLRRNSVSGAVEAVPRSGTWGTLNAALHAND